MTLIRYAIFNELKEGERYANNRPYFHPQAIKRAKKAAGLENTVPLGLDVACGTGHSARALKSISDQVMGMDISWNMLANAQVRPFFANATATFVFRTRAWYLRKETDRQQFDSRLAITL